MASNTRLFCPSCGCFVIRVERVNFEFALHCDRCHQDIEFRRQTTEMHTLPNGRKMTRLIILFPGATVPELPGPALTDIEPLTAEPA